MHERTHGRTQVTPQETFCKDRNAKIHLASIHPSPPINAHSQRLQYHCQNVCLYFGAFFEPNIKFNRILNLPWYQISIGTNINIKSNININIKYQISANIKFRPTLNFGQYQISANIKFRSISNFGRDKFSATRGVAEN